MKEKEQETEVNEAQIAVHWKEEQYFYPSAKFIGQAYLTDISGKVNVWEEGDHYVVQVTADDKENVKLSLGERKAHLATGSDVAIGDVVAALEDGSEPLVAPMAGKVEITDKAVIITPTKQSVLRYEIPGFKQMLVKDGDKVVAGQRLTNGSINLHDLMRLQGVEPTQRYIMNQILQIFAGQGQNIADKHLEIIVRQMFIQVGTPDEMRGRVNAVDMIFIGTSNELGQFESGLTAQWFGAVPAVVLGGLGTLLVTGLWAWNFPELRRAGERSQSAE